MRARTIRNPSGGASVSRAGLAGLAMLAASCWASAGLAQERVALVIGNGAYAHAGDLRNPPNDARLMARTLEALGFAVERVFDADRSTLYRALATFSAKAPEAEVALVFYAGHGIETEGRNYLIPVDAKLETVESTRFEAAPLEDVSAAAAGARTLSLVILDACRDSPFARRFRSLRGLRSTARGLRSIEPAGRNALVAYAAKHGTAALDGEGQANSPFTTALADALRAPPKDVRLLFGGVRDAVLAATGGAQEPFLYGSLGGREILLAPRGRAGETAPAEPRTPSGTSRSEPPPAPFDPGEAIPEDPPIEASAMQGVLGRSRADATPREDAPYEEPTSGFAGAREDGPLRDEVAAEGGDEWPREDLPFEEPPSESAGVREDGPPRDEVAVEGGDEWPREDLPFEEPPSESAGAREDGPPSDGGATEGGDEWPRASGGLAGARPGAIASLDRRSEAPGPDDPTPPALIGARTGAVADAIGREDGPIAPEGAPLTPAPSVADAPEPRAAAPSRGRYRLSFGAWPTRAQIRQDWAALRAAHPDLLDGLDLDIQPATVRDGTAYRLQVAGFHDRDRAKRACVAFRGRGVNCLVVSRY